MKSCQSTVKVTDNTKLKAIGVGPVTFPLNLVNGGGSIKLQQVLMVPVLNCNLISMGKIEEQGYSLVVKQGFEKCIQQGR